MQNDQVTIHIPATTANLGPGFDCLGLALDLWNTIHMEVSSHTQVTINGEGIHELPTTTDNLTYQAAAHIFVRTGQPIPPLSITSHNRIPLKRGLGSSAAAIVGGLLGANHICGYPFSTHQLLKEATHFEGHSDNVTAALIGGLQIVVTNDDGVHAANVPLPKDLMIIVLIPEKPISTTEARAILPSTISREDAVHNISRVAMLVNALSGDRVGDLRLATEDRIHQPYRERLMPAMSNIFRAALDAGSLGVFLSGSGPTIMALTRGKEMTISYEMADAARRMNVPCKIEVTKPSIRGAYTTNINQEENI